MFIDLNQKHTNRNLQITIQVNKHNNSSNRPATMKHVILLLLFGYLCHAQEYEFPSDFYFGAATSAYQVEGAWNISGKGENIWDRLLHTRPDFVDDLSNGDIACDAYHKTDEDVQLLKNMGAKFYRFSISWARILPTGQVNNVNPDGIRYYNELIDTLLANGIDPVPTMYHWDLPQSLQDIGGWPSPLIIQHFEDYARLLYDQFGDRVKTWITINEPQVICEGGYGAGYSAPAHIVQGIGNYLCAHNVLLSHARAYRLYEREYKATQGGRVGITIDSGWYEPDSDSQEDIDAAERQLQMGFGWLAHPIFSSDGDYPPIMKERIARQSAEEGYPRSRLPEFTPEEIELLKGSSDFFGFNHYTTNLCYPLPEGWGDRPSLLTDIGSLCYQDENWEPAATAWLKVVPWGFRKILNWIKDQYNNPEVIITENGFSDRGEIHDCRRVNYYNSYLEQMLKAMYEDGCNVTGYAAWSFMDNFEWPRGFTEKFGLHHVDFDDPARPRTPKMSSYVYKNIIQTKRIDWDFTPDNFTPCVW